MTLDQLLDAVRQYVAERPGVRIKIDVKGDRIRVNLPLTPPQPTNRATTEGAAP